MLLFNFLFAAFGVLFIFVDFSFYLRQIVIINPIHF